MAAVADSSTVQGVAPGQWTYGLFACTAGGMGNCLYGCCCPWCAFATARTTYDDSNCLFNFCCATPPMVQSIIREGAGIDGSCIGDICVTILCMECAAVRCLNEAKVRKVNKMDR